MAYRLDAVLCPCYENDSIAKTMKIKRDKIQQLIHEIDHIHGVLCNYEAKYRDAIRQVHPKYRQSAQNLIHYRALRTIDLTGLQKSLGNLGLSRMARAEPHVMDSLVHCKYMLEMLIGRLPLPGRSPAITFKQARKTLKSHTKDLLGYRSKGRRVRVMVTLPSQAAYDYQLVHDLLLAGMNTVRINCAHDGPSEWKQMINHVEAARLKLNKRCRISMDLAGPKIRTGAIEDGPQVRRFRPSRNEFGQVTEPAVVVLTPELNVGNDNEIPVDPEWLSLLQPGDQVSFIDTRDKQRLLSVTAVTEEQATAICVDTFYIKTGSILTIASTKHHTTVAALPALEQALLLKTGDHLRIIKESSPGRPAIYDESGVVIEHAFISCTSSAIFEDVKPGEHILFDDGKITGLIESVSDGEITVAITHAKGGSAYLKADKGINLPDTNLHIKGLTAKDREDLKFIAEYANVVNFSFVNSPEDVRELIEELDKLGAHDKLGVILKIETRDAYDNLTEILLEGMKIYPLGVMIARGDLAIETGWEHIARIQQEILSLCSAAHIPDVWATQVLESLAKKGIPSRSEITDAAAALNAECVMLNKGPYILKAVELLDHILKNMGGYREKNVKMMPAMEKAASTSM